MARTDDLLLAALKSLESKPSNDATRAQKKRYSEKMSAAIALALADELRQRGCHDARPAPPGELGGSGAERRLAGGIGAKKVDVTWTTEESGLLLGISVKTINFIDKRSGNFQKNLTNRRSDMLIEAVTLHRRFPYAVLGGLLFLDAGAARDDTARRKSTFQNAHPRMQLFTGRNDPAGREEQYEGLYLLLVEASCFAASTAAYEVGAPETEVTLAAVITRLLTIVAERNFDFYEMDAENIRRT